MWPSCVGANKYASSGPMKKDTTVNTQTAPIFTLKNILHIVALHNVKPKRKYKWHSNKNPQLSIRISQGRREKAFQ